MSDEMIPGSQEKHISGVRLVGWMCNILVINIHRYVVKVSKGSVWIERFYTIWDTGNRCLCIQYSARITNTIQRLYKYSCMAVSLTTV